MCCYAVSRFSACSLSPCHHIPTVFVCLSVSQFVPFCLPVPLSFSAPLLLSVPMFRGLLQTQHSPSCYSVSLVTSLPHSLGKPIIIRDGTVWPCSLSL